jgi:hypothetical protein
MTPWPTYTKNSTIVKTTDPISELIINTLGSKLGEFYSDSKHPRKVRTRLIKIELAKLGHLNLDVKPPYKVYCNGLVNEQGILIGEFSNKEWLFDLQWYTENGPYLPASLPLVVECEWKTKKKADSKTPSSGIKYDFQKLLVANADLRLMIFIIKNDIQLSELDQYFELAIKGYRNLPPHAKFLFVAFDKKEEKLHYCEKIKMD